MIDSSNPQHGLVFEIYPGSGIGASFSEAGALQDASSTLLGPPDDPAQIKKALDELQMQKAPFLVRGYLHYIGSGRRANITPVNMEQYVSEQKHRKLDLAVCYRTNENNMQNWLGFIRQIIREYGPFLAKIQVTEEPNNPNSKAGGDGSFAGVRRALIEGVIAAKNEVIKAGYHIQVGFNAVPSFNPADDFWKEIATLNSSNSDFLSSLDYVGFDFYPGVFRPLPPSLTLKNAVAGVLTSFRTTSLATGGIPSSVPIHLAENGYPTSPTRSYEQQAANIEETIRTIYNKRIELNITHYTFFDLRDANSAKEDLEFGLLRDDYTPKPAFEVFKKMIQELSI